MNEQIDNVPSLLILAGDPDLAEGIRVYLEDSYRIYILSDLIDLYMYLKNYKIDLLLIDIDSTGLNQLQQLQFIKSAHPYLKMVVMYMFLDEEEQSEKSALRAADDFIFKPFSASVLKHKLDQLLVPALNKGTEAIRHLDTL
jgi:DNA-binding response OmpR family regulator